MLSPNLASIMAYPCSLRSIGHSLLEPCLVETRQSDLAELRPLRKQLELEMQ